MEAYHRRKAELEYVYPSDISLTIKTKKDIKPDKHSRQFIDMSKDALNKTFQTQFPTASSGLFGSVTQTGVCEICRGIDCPGHRVYLAFPRKKDGKRIMIAKPKHAPTIHKLLSVFCHECKNLILSMNIKEDQAILSKIENAPRDRRLEILVKETRSMTTYQECIKPTKAGKNKILVCSCKRKPKTLGEIETLFPFHEAKAHEKRGKKTKKAQPSECEDLSEEKDKVKVYSPREAYEILKDIDQENDLLKYTGLTIDQIKSFFATGISLISPKYRPDFGPDNQNEITTIYKNIFTICRDSNLESSEIINKLTHYFGEMKDYVAKLVNGKKAILRNQMEGKRPDFNYRTVIVPGNPDTPFGVVEIGSFIARHALMRVEYITPENIEAMQELMFQDGIGIVNKGSGRGNLWKEIIVAEDNFADNSAHILEVGDRVYLRARDGDYIYTGRQPTNNMQNVIGAKIKIVEDGILQSPHTSLLTGFGGDFDGDTMHGGRLQNKFAEEELANQMNPVNMLRTYQSNKAITGLFYNATTAAAILTANEIGVTQELFDRATSLYKKDPRMKTFIKRCNFYNVNPLSGKALFSTLLPEDFYFTLGKPGDFNYVDIRQGILLRGMITKKIAGGGMSGLIDKMVLGYPGKTGNEIAGRFISEGTSMLTHFLNAVGHTITYDDCLLGKESYQPEVRKALNDVKDKILKLRRPENEFDAMIYEKQVSGFINSMNEVGREHLKPTKDTSNALLFASDRGAGTKGSEGNLYTIAVSIGQQYEAEGRLAFKTAESSRCTAVNRPYDIFPEARGYIASSYVSGKTPFEAWAGSAGGRAGIAATTTTTPKVGEVKRDLESTLGDMQTENGSVIFNGNSIIEWCYGSDSMDGLYLEKIQDDFQSVDLAFFANKLNKEYEANM